MNDLEVCSWPIDRVIPYARNSRKIPERAIDKVAASIKEFGWRVPIVVDKDGVIICGHTRHWRRRNSVFSKCQCTWLTI